MTSNMTYIDNWLDDNVSSAYKNEPLAQDWARISKVSEELGEAVQAFIGFTGQNPRKGYCNKIEDVLNELADTACTAILAIQHFTKDEDRSIDIMARRWISIAERCSETT